MSFVAGACASVASGSMGWEAVASGAGACGRVDSVGCAGGGPVCQSAPHSKHWRAVGDRSGRPHAGHGGNAAAGGGSTGTAACPRSTRRTACSISPRVDRPETPCRMVSSAVAAAARKCGRGSMPARAAIAQRAVSRTTRSRQSPAPPPVRATAVRPTWRAISGAICR
ncbi:MAG: hypothetical protein U0871_09570 [Gemmataceae bacterium]